MATSKLVKRTQYEDKLVDEFTSEAGTGAAFGPLRADHGIGIPAKRNIPSV
jgi:hypothetical protein